jgi:hypothetical protein
MFKMSVLRYVTHANGKRGSVNMGVEYTAVYGMFTNCIIITISVQYLQRKPNEILIRLFV